MAGLLKEISSLPSALEITEGGSDFVHLKVGDSDRKIRVYDLFKWHTDITIAGTNPHETTKADVGLGTVLNAPQLQISQNLADVANVVTARSNLQVLSGTETQTAIDSHADRTDNPHGVRKNQLLENDGTFSSGLSNVQNWVYSTDQFEVSDTKYATIGAVARTAQRLDDYIQSLTGTMSMHIGLSTTIPDGWLELKGQTVLELQDAGYAILAQWVRDNFPSTNALPDTRGYFPRGWDNGAGIDPSTGRANGSIQQDAMIQHTHSISSAGAHTHNRGTMNITGDFGQNINCGASGAFFKSGTSGSVAQKEFVSASKFNFDASRTWSGETSSSGNHTHTIGNTGSGTETRPKNFAVMFIIKHDS